MMNHGRKEKLYNSFTKKLHQKNVFKNKIHSLKHCLSTSNHHCGFPQRHYYHYNKQQPTSLYPLISISSSLAVPIFRAKEKKTSTTK